MLILTLVMAASRQLGIGGIVAPMAGVVVTGGRDFLLDLIDRGFDRIVRHRQLVRIDVPNRF